MPAAIMQSNNNDEHDIVVANQTQGGSSYTARLMDDEAIQSLRRDLREYEVNIARHGHLQEYVASKPVQVSRIELLQSTSSGNTYDPPTTPSTLGTPRQTSRRQHPSSVIRHRDSFATAMVKHHLGFDPLMKTDDDIENQDITPIAAPATTGDTLLLPCRPASATSTSCQTTLPSKPTSCRPATVNVGKGEGARQRSYTKVHSEEKASLQGLEAQYFAAKDMLLRHMDRWGVHSRPDGDVSHSVFAKLSKFDEKVGIHHPEDADHRKHPRSSRQPPPVTSVLLPLMSSSATTPRQPHKQVRVHQK